MAETKTQNFQHLNQAELKTLGKVARSSNESIMSAINSELETPLRLHATFPTADSKLNFSQAPTIAADGSNRAIPPVKSQVYTLAASSIDFQTQATTGATFLITWPTSTDGYYRRAGFSLLANGSIQVLFTAEASTLGALANPGTVFVKTGIPLGYIDLKCSGGTTKFKTADSSSNVIENANIYRFGSGAGGSGGSGDANSFTENLKHRLTSSYYEFVTPNVFDTDENTLINSSTAAFSIVDGAYVFSAAGQNIVSKNMFCTEYLANEDESLRSELHVEWVDSTTRDDNAVYELSIDGVNYQTVSMARQGLSDKFIGDKQLSIPSSSALFSQNTETQTTELNATVLRSIAAKFSVTSKCAINTLAVTLVKTGSPDGSYIISIVKDSSNSPTGDVVYSTIALASALSAGSNILTLNGFRNLLVSGDYWIKVETDATYKSTFSAGTKSVGIRSTTGTNLVWNGLSWSAGTAGIKYSVSGHLYDLRVRITSSASGKKLKAYGVFYSEKVNSVITGVQSLQKFSFSGDSDVTTFAVTKFLPSADILKVYDIKTGQVYRYPAFSISGYSVIFPSGSFLVPGETVELIFDQQDGVGYDNSDFNANLLATNHLGSTDPSIDKSVAGRGIFIRRPDGVLREICIDDTDTIVIYSV